jgi:hypothetical protein
MQNMEKMTIENEVWVKESSMPKSANKLPQLPLVIAILNRGYVYLGRMERKGDELLLHECKNVRKWGTTKGLGQLAIEGPQENTVLDECGSSPTITPWQNVVTILYCEESAWS